MKEKLICLSILIMLFFSSCSNHDEPSPSNEGSPRDWTYLNDQIKFYIDDVEQTSVSEITVRSLQLKTEGENPPFPWYSTTLKVKGLLPKNKIFEIEILADVERFEGTTSVNGIEYDVTGEYTGSPFEHYKDMGIIVNLNKKL